MVTKIGLDLGYANISLCDASYEVYREPSIALIDKNSRRILSVGKEALREDALQGILVRPFKNGLLYSIEFTKEIIGSALSRVALGDTVRSVVGVPSSLNQKQTGELARLIAEAGCEECFFVNRAVASLVGAGFAPTMSVISVNIGASATEIAIIHKGKIIYSVGAQIGGEDFDEAVRSYILKNGELNISLIDARAIKESIGAVWEGREAEPITVSGTLALTGNKIKMSIASEDILGVFEPPLHKLLAAVADAIKTIPAEYTMDILENGIVLTGGGAKLFGLDKMMKNVFGISAVTMKDAEYCVARGLMAICNFLPSRIRSVGKNITDKVAGYYTKSTEGKN